MLLILEADMGEAMDDFVGKRHPTAIVDLVEDALQVPSPSPGPSPTPQPVRPPRVPLSNTHAHTPVSP